METKNNFVTSQNSIPLNQLKNKHKYQILKNYWKKRKRV